MTITRAPESAAATTDRRKAAVWALIAGLTHTALLAYGHEAFPYLRDILLAPSHLLLLPAVAYLHVRDAAGAPRGATLGTIAAIAAVLLGLLAALTVEARPAALFALALWWWCSGKLWATTRGGHRALGTAMAVAAPLVFVGALFVNALGPLTALAPGVPDLRLWDVSRMLVAVWSIALAAALWRSSGDVA